MRDSGKQGRPDEAQPLSKNALKSGKDLSQRERTAITTRIARMLALDLQPYSCVENWGFRELMNHMEPLYKIPSRTTFSRTIILELYKDTVMAVKERMHADFQEGVESISLTNEKLCVESRSVTESHTACNILEHLQAMMDNWELPLQKLKEAICLELAISETTVPNLARQEWKAVAGLVKALEPIASATKDLSGHKYATHKERVSSIWNSIEKLAVSSERRHSTETANIKEFKRYLREPTCSKDQTL
ncbi:hypothetical protein HPB52_023087 [Rhipicephalus sanguineus]|uniref:Uncharacterized protein n=1 Tax=Rhipicephalus sanguineus TaxID=34632 RepID=A0A9D4Q7T7_RHISA|nr:hypothetical protein HPB52_023087 [Rhipicephalus sanguineus]